ncbi:MAG: gluconate 2-dehydrogenase subunit 3 family protein [Bacteroidetes bacterium]|nr:MAG: gluconate 2-dehydrogenase subunit 3 family protein [Bacteroidota bacterium]
MKRREALKNIGLSLGAITMSSTVISLIQSCSTGATWNPNFFSVEEAEIIAKTLDVILPATSNIPGANDLNLTQFIDGYIHKISTEQEKEGFKTGIGQYLSTSLEITGKRKAAALTTNDIEGRLAFYLKADAEQQKVWDAEIANTIDSPSEDAINFSVLVLLRSRGISAFKISEQIGENVLAYDPVPGQQKGCVNLQEATQGKAWSL